MSLSDAIVRILAEDMGPAGRHFYNHICLTMNKQPESLTGEDLEVFAKYAYATAKRSLDEQTAWSLYNRILQLKK